jgi:hypothetical protein
MNNAKTIRVALTLGKEGNANGNKGKRHFNVTFTDDLTDEQRFEFALRHASTRWRNEQALCTDWPGEDNSAMTVSMADLYFTGRGKTGPRDPVKAAAKATESMTSDQLQAFIEAAQRKLAGFTA